MKATSMSGKWPTSTLSNEAGSISGPAISQKARRLKMMVPRDWKTRSMVKITTETQAYLGAGWELRTHLRHAQRAGHRM